jgi:hypothetical protein
MLLEATAAAWRVMMEATLLTGVAAARRVQAVRVEAALELASLVALERWASAAMAVVRSAVQLD